MHDARLGQSTKYKYSSLFLVVQTCKLEHVDTFFEPQYSDKQLHAVIIIIILKGWQLPDGF